MDNLRKLIRSYEAWVAANPETVSDVEITSKWISYFIAGRISDSTVVSELVYSLSNILVLYNDRIIDKTRRGNDTFSKGGGASTSAAARTADSNNKRQKHVYRLKVMLTTLEYCEVFIEISAKRVFGTKGKWIFVTLVQLTKAIGRFFIMMHSTEQIITSPAIPKLNRRLFIKKQKSAGKNGVVIENVSDANGLNESSFTFQLKRSGRVVRKVDGAPPLQYRDFMLTAQIKSNNAPAMHPGLVQAEYLYIAKPLIHLAAMGLFGEKHWKQYVIALALDVISIKMYHQHREHMTKEQKLELSRRSVNLLLYLMRSPLYERATRSKLDIILGLVAEMPLVRMVAAPLRDYLPYWQSTYFYLWST